MSNNVLSHQFQLCDTQIVRKEHMSDSLTSSHGFQNTPVSNVGGFRQNEVTASGLGLQSSTLPIKRKAEMEIATRHSFPPQVALPNKHVGPAGSSPRLSSHKKHVPMQSKVIPIASQNLPALNKKLMRNDSTSGKSGSYQIQTPKSRNTESNDSVRSKLRDQFAAALSMVFLNKEETSSGEHFSTGESGNSQKSWGEVSTDESMFTPNPSSKELRSSIFPEEDGLFVKDDLLQGNGLSWASYDFDMGSTEMMEVHDTEKIADLKNDTKRSSPEDLALEIEAELFKLFGGVNKKYKEKGRSLLFNLKDRSNPELRERVMSGEIPPDRLCAMSAEELASKELSDWRMAKAEEFAQMKVLPDTDLSLRRLVRKTHKGEYQVDFEQDYAHVEKDVPVQSILESREKEEEEAINGRTGTGNQEISGSLVIPSDGTDLMQGIMVDELKDAEFLTPIISLDDFMESLDSEPPFEDLQVDAAAAAANTNVSSTKEEIQVYISVGDDANTTTKEVNEMVIVDVAPPRPNESAVVREIDVAPNRIASPVVQQTHLPKDTVSPKIEHIWAGILQLSISSSITTFGVFKSGEKTSTAEWSSSLEIKGRVRVDAFEKFIKELPNSRTRAVMVLHLVLKDKSSESERANLAEAVESYISDERLGFAEPASGVELYVCPPHEKMLNVLGNYVVDHRDDFLNSSENGLIGIVVWRKAPITKLLSPNSSSHHKQHNSSKRQIKDINNVNVKSMPPPPPQAPLDDDDDDDDIPPGFGPPATRDDDDLPEFSFVRNVTPMHNTSNTRPPQRPVDQLRQLILKYGQNDVPSGVGNNPFLDNKKNNIGIAIESWNDDDDDMPEWRPNLPLPPSHPSFARTLQPQPPTYGNQHLTHTGIQHQHHLNARPVVSGSPLGWQHLPMHVQPPGNFGNPPPIGGLPSSPVPYAGQRQDGSRSRGI